MEISSDLPVRWPEEQIRAFCTRWSIIELALFGSVLRQDFGPTSDVDLLARFAPDARHGLFGHARMERELEGILRRKVDLVTVSAIEQSASSSRKAEILGTARPIYAA